MKKWSIYQILMLFLIFLQMWLLEYIDEIRIIQHSPNGWSAINSAFVTFLIMALVITCIYLIFLFEAKKRKSLLNHSIWAKMPKICVTVGILSVILFLIGGIFGPIMAWVEQWRSLLYIFLIYFLFLIFLFIFSIEHKRHQFKQRNDKAVHISYIWTLLLFFALFFLF